MLLITSLVLKYLIDKRTTVRVCFYARNPICFRHIPRIWRAPIILRAIDSEEHTMYEGVCRPAWAIWIMPATAQAVELHTSTLEEYIIYVG